MKGGILTLVAGAAALAIGWYAQPEGAGVEPLPAVGHGGVTPASTTHGSRGARTACLTQPGLQTGGTYSDVDCAPVCGTPTGMMLRAENFVLSEAVEIDALRFWGAYYPSDILQNPDRFTVIFREDDITVPQIDICQAMHRCTESTATTQAMW